LKEQGEETQSEAPLKNHGTSQHKEERVKEKDAKEQPDEKKRQGGG